MYRPAMKADRSRAALAASALMLLPLLVYLPLRSAGFVWDDDSYVTQNQNLRSAAGLFRIWFDPRSIPQYYPLVHTSYWAEFQLWGLSARATTPPTCCCTAWAPSCCGGFSHDFACRAPGWRLPSSRSTRS